MTNTTIPERRRDRFLRPFRSSSESSPSRRLPLRSNPPLGSTDAPSTLLSSTKHPGDNASAALHAGQLASATGSGKAIPVTHGRAMLDKALNLLSEKEKIIIQKYILSTADDISTALLQAHTAAKEKQKVCVDKRWTFNFNGHTVKLRDEADKVTMWLDRFKFVGDLASNVDPIHFGLPWAGVRVMLEAAVSESHRMASLLIGLKISLYMMKRLEVYLSYLEGLLASPARSHFENSLIEFHALLLSFLARAIQTYDKSTAARAFESFWKLDEILTFETECDKVGARVEVEASNCDRNLSRDDARQQRAQFNKVLADLKKMQDIKQAVATLSRKIDMAKLPVAQGAAYNSHEDEYEVTCLENTRTEILQQIKHWPDEENAKRIYWLNGMAGTGKSTICRTIARHFDENNRLGASFFFKRGEGDRANASRFFTSLATQLAITLPDVEPYVADAINADPLISGKALKEQFDNLILQPLSKIPYFLRQSSILIIAIDALDECENESDIKTILRLFATAKDVKAVSLRIFVTSRPDLPIRLGFSEISKDRFQDFVLHEIPKATIEHDIYTYLIHEFERINAEYARKRPQCSLDIDWPGKHTLHTLVEMAVPLFIFAATMCRFIADPRGNPQKRLTNVLNLQAAGQLSNLDRTYLPILNQLLIDQDEAQKSRIVEEFRDVVGTIVNLASPLTADGLSKLLECSQEDIYDTVELLHSVLNVPSNEKAPIKLLHLSFRDFLLDPKKQTKTPFWIDKREAHKMIAEKCLQLLSKSGILRKNICDLPTPGTRLIDVDRQTVDTLLPAEVQYACRYWVYHLEQSEQVIRDEGEAHAFLRVNFLYWLEALSLIGSLFESISMMKILQSSLAVSNGNEAQNSENNALSIFISDALRFIMSYQHIITDAPLQLYYAALIFAPQNSVVRQHFHGEAPNSIERISRIRENWTSLLQTFEGHTHFVTSIAFSLHDARLLASASYDQTVRLWDVTTGLALWMLEGHTHIVTSIAFSPHDPKLLASGSDDMTVRLWDTATGSMLQTLEGHTNTITSIAFSPHDPKLLASGSDDKTVRLWDTAIGSILRTLKGYSDQVMSIAFSPHDPKLLVSGSYDETVRLWDIATGSMLQTLKGHSAQVMSIAFSPHDPKLLASGSYDWTVRLWDIATGSMLQTLEGHSYSVRSIAFSPHHPKLLASASDDGTVRLWDIAIGSMLQTLEGHSNRVRDIAFSPYDPKLLASASHDETVRLWDIATGSILQTLEGYSDRVRDIVFSPDGKLLAVRLDDGTVRLWDIATGSALQTLEGHSGWVRCIAFSPDGKLLASGSDDRTVRLWDIVTGSALQTLEGHGDWVNCIAFSPDGKLLASGSDYKTVRLWDIATGSAVQTLEGHSHWVNCIAFSPDGKLLASGSDDRTVRLWDIATGSTALQTLEGHSDCVTSIVFSPDGKLLASASFDETIRLWDTATGSALQTLHIGGVVCRMSFSGDGQYLETDRGLLKIESSGSSLTRTHAHSSNFIYLEGDWINQGGDKILWLPPDYRETCSALHQSLVALGHASGQITILKFSS